MFNSHLTAPAITAPSRHHLAILASGLVLAAGATAATVAIVGDDDGSVAAPALSSGPGADGVRYDGGPEEGTAALRPATSVRFHGGPIEGSAPIHTDAAPLPVRFHGGPIEGLAPIRTDAVAPATRPDDAPRMLVGGPHVR
jgi:hypothetical protein